LFEFLDLLFCMLEITRGVSTKPGQMVLILILYSFL
jgi:hypothetical protein